MAYQQVVSYQVILDGNDNAVPQFNTMSVILRLASGYHTYEYHCDTEHAFEKIKMLIDLLRNEANVWFDPDKNRFGVGTEQVGEKDKP